MTARARHRAELMARTPRGGFVCALGDGRRGTCGQFPPSDLQADHVLEVAWLRVWLDQRAMRGEPLACRRCEGRGWVFGFGEAGPFDCPACLGSGLAILDDLVADARNGWWLCDRHHTLKTRKLLRPELTRVELPPSVETFARDYECEHMLDRRFGVRAGA